MDAHIDCNEDIYSDTLRWKIMDLLLYLLAIVLTIMCYYFYKNHYTVPKKYAECMADTYIHGYLEKIIPDSGSHDMRGIRERIRHYIAKRQLSSEDFPFSKLFIIIPSSGRVPAILDDLDESNRIKVTECLEPVVLSRAGTECRVYKTAVYKIFFRGTDKHIYFAMEGAPPLLCLIDSCKHNPELNKFEKELIYMFYTKLLEKLNENEELKQSCELIYFQEEGSLADYLIIRYIEGK